MSPLDRITQLNARVSELETANALLRSQLKDGQEQAKRDSATINRLERSRDLAILSFECAYEQIRH